MLMFSVVAVGCCWGGVALVGGNWNNSAKTGTFYLNLNNDTSNRNRNISGHLVYARYINLIN